MAPTLRALRDQTIRVVALEQLPNAAPAHVVAAASLIEGPAALLKPVFDQLGVSLAETRAALIKRLAPPLLDVSANLSLSAVEPLFLSNVETNGSHLS